MPEITNTGYSKLGTVSTRIKRSMQEKGILHVFFIATKATLNLLANFFWCYTIYKPFKSTRTFTFQRKTYRYFYHWYNTAWKNERTVEIPLMLTIINNYHGKKILEVGNVLSHYVPITHTILDKYEEGPNVINEDIVDFKPQDKYDLIVSISTLEHVGWDERPRDPKKILYSIENLKKLLAIQGKLVVTFPLGYNKNLDKLLVNNYINFTNSYYLRRIDKHNAWEETSWENVKNIKYNGCLESLVIGIIEKT